MALRFLNSGYFAGKVGIGIETPTSTLHVAGPSTLASQGTVLKIESTADQGSSQDIHIYNQYDRDIGIKFETLGGENYIWQDSNGDDALIISTGGSNRTNDAALILNQAQNVFVPNGKVGIGATSADHLLTLQSSGDTILQINRKDDTIPGGNRTGIIQFGARGSWGTNLQTSKIWSYAEETFTSTANGTSLRFFTTELGAATADEKMIIDTNGNVGIGTSSPSYRLTAYGSSADSEIVASFGSANDQNEYTAIGLSGFIASNGATKAGLALKRTATYGTGELHFLNNNTLDNSDITLSDSKMMIDDSGNVGIGTISPGNFTGLSFSDPILDVAGIVQSRTGNIALGGTSYRKAALMTSTGTDAPYLDLRVSGSGTSSSTTTRMRIDSAGNVGINTTTPAYKLDVNGGARSTHFRDGSRGNGTTSTTAGWYKVASWTGGSARGGSEIKLSTTGGSFTPITWIIRCYKNWSYDATLKLEQYGYSNIYFTKARIVRDTTTNIVYVEIYQPGTTAVAFQMYQSSLMGYDSNVTMVTGTLAAGTTSANASVRAELPFVAGGTSVEALTIGDSGNTGPYLPLAGGTMTGNLRLNDSVQLKLGTSSKTAIYNDGTDTYIQQTSGNLYLWQSANDKDIIFASDDGSGGVTEYFRLDGGLTKSVFSKNLMLLDSVKAQFGDSNDLEIYHDGTDSIIADTGTGNLYIRGAASMRLQGINQSNFLIATQGGNVNLYYNNANKFNTSNTGVNITGEISLNGNKALLSNQENTDVDTGAEVVAQVSTSTYTAAFFDFVIKKTTNVRSGTVYACHDGTNVEFTETSTNDLGDTSDVTLSVDKSGTNMRLLATVTSDDWSVKSLIRAI